MQSIVVGLVLFIVVCSGFFALSLLLDAWIRRALPGTKKKRGVDTDGE